MGMRVISSSDWTIDGRWVVVADWHGSERIVYDPPAHDPWDGLRLCLKFVRENEGRSDGD